MSVDWGYFNKFDEIDDKYLPPKGEGNNMATQIVTAVNKLVYKWYNDGDVFDSSYNLSGWWNDLSSYANWLYTYLPITRNILDNIKDCYNDSDYEDLLKELCDTTQTFEFLAEYENKPTVGTIYDCDGPYQFTEEDEDIEDEDWYEDEDEDEDY